MKTLPIILSGALAAVPGLAKERPNIIYILADDLGYTEIGAYGQKLIETPNLDLLAKNGIKFTQHYCGSPVSAPSRCVLLTGQHSGHAYIRGKGFVHEGGIRVPMIASWPGKIKPGTETNLISCFYDVLPTLCEVAGIKVPAETDGISFLPTLIGKKNQTKHDYLFWDFPEYDGQQAVRLGPWKAMRLNMQKGNTAIQLFNVETDSKEQTDVAAQNPEIVKQVLDIMKKEHQKSSFSRFYIKAIDGN